MNSHCYLTVDKPTRIFELGTQEVAGSTSIQKNKKLVDFSLFYLLKISLNHPLPFIILEWFLNVQNSISVQTSTEEGHSPPSYHLEMNGWSLSAGNLIRGGSWLIPHSEEQKIFALLITCMQKVGCWFKLHSAEQKYVGYSVMLFTENFSQITFPPSHLKMNDWSLSTKNFICV